LSKTSAYEIAQSSAFVPMTSMRELVSARSSSSILTRAMKRRAVSVISSLVDASSVYVVPAETVTPAERGMLLVFEVIVTRRARRSMADSVKTRCTTLLSYSIGIQSSTLMFAPPAACQIGRPSDVNPRMLGTAISRSGSTTQFVRASGVRVIRFSFARAHSDRNARRERSEKRSKAPSRGTRLLLDQRS
jgi:hypothetical protein